MADFLTAVGLLSCLTSSAAAGYLIGVRRTLARWRRADERIARITGDIERRGEPHNYDAPPARVTQGRMRNRRTWTNP